MGPLSASGSWRGSSDPKVAIRIQSWEACDDWCDAAVLGRGPKAAKGGRVAAAGGGHRARPGRTRQRICVEGPTGGALCPGCPYPEGQPEGRPSRSLLTPFPSHAGCTWPPSSHSLLEDPRQEPLSPHSCRHSTVGSTFPAFTQPWPLIVGLRAFC